MRKMQASATAKGTAAMRAIESEKPADERICYDPFARRFTDTIYYFLIKLFAGYGERRTHGALTFIVCRSRYFDDYLQECLESGTAQLVILGAGLDSRAYRDERLQGVVKTFEVDHPASQVSKIRRVRKVFGEIPTNVTYVPIDFNNETLDKLFTYGFDRSLKTLFMWEGVTHYLDAEAVDATLSWVHANAASGSAIIFDYQYVSAPIQAQRRRDYLYAVISRLAGERRAFSIEKGQIEDFLERRGFTHVVDANPEQLQYLYCTGFNQDRKVAKVYAIVHAEVKLVENKNRSRSS
jgi:methyltransferase (TIGR00027 family)